jgi:hypothetical protein
MLVPDCRLWRAIVRIFGRPPLKPNWEYDKLGLTRLRLRPAVPCWGTPEFKHPGTPVALPVDGEEHLRPDPDPGNVHGHE